MTYIDANDLVFNTDNENGIHTGGFSVKSIMMKEGLSPIMTINNDQIGGSNLVSDLFNNLVVPNWALSYYNPMFGGEHKKKIIEEIFEENEEERIINDDLHNKLLDLVKQHDLQEKIKESKKKITRKERTKKGGTKKRKI